MLAVDFNLLKDINVLPLSSNPEKIVEVGSVAFFTATTATHGTELWKSDGTAAGTVLVKDILAGSSSSTPYSLTNVGGTLYFTANDSINGTELWKSDGTAAGTVLFKDIRTGSLSSSPNNLTNIGGTLYFTANDGTSGYELWKSDGTAAGTVKVKDIRGGALSSSARDLTNAGGTLYFTANDGTNGYELWKSDGTAAGTVLVKDIRVGSSTSTPNDLTNVGGTLYFSANDGTTGFELWKSDGTAAGTVLVKDIRVGSSSSNPSDLTNVGGTLYFTADDVWSGNELWKSDGTAVGTVLVKDILVGFYGSSPTYLTNVGGTLYFQAFDLTTPTLPLGLWKSDGTEAGTVRLEGISSLLGFALLTNVEGTLYFTANDGTSGYELWKSDGTVVGTVRVKDILAGSSNSVPRYLTNVGGTLYFTAIDGASGRELWKSDGSAAGTVIVKDILGSADSTAQPSALSSANVGGTLYFSANDGTNGYELWKTDGTAAGTVVVKDIAVGAGDSSPDNFANVNGTLYFSAYDSTNGYELWKSNGTAVGTVLVKDIRIGASGSRPFFLTNIGGTVYFTANDGTGGNELWKSDGTAAGTVLVKDIRPGANSSAPASLTNVAGTLYFVANDGTTGDELWKSDGSAAGTVLVKDISVGALGSGPLSFANVAGTLYFGANDGTNGVELWKSDGTAVGTVLVKNIRAGSSGSDLFWLANVGGTLYFSANDGTSGLELWKSDGTTAGTVLVKDIRTGSVSSNAKYLTNVDGTLYFVANDGTHGYELWQSDGTAAGTVLVKDFTADSSSSNPSQITDANGRLFVAATTAQYGSEIWVADLTPPVTYDYGDAPDTGAGTGPGNYNALATDNGPRHGIVTGLKLGANVDSDSGTLQNGAATADDLSPTVPDDEDGLVEAGHDLLLTIGAAPQVRVRATNTTGTAANLYGWIDYNHDGVFDNATERTTVAVPNGTNNGTFTLSFPAVPNNATPGITYARFRLSTDAAAANPTGTAQNGEVEDYAVTILAPSSGLVDNTKSQKIASSLSGGPPLADRDFFGGSVAALGDLDGDGVRDLIVGAFSDDTGGSYRGAVYVLLMNANGTAKSTVKIASNTNGGPTLANGDRFGLAVANLGDVDGDGITDAGVGVYDDDTGGTDRGAMYVLLLNANGTVKSSLKIASGTSGGPTLSDGDHFGCSITSLGDLDGDGVNDLAVGARGDDTGGSYRGAVYVLFMNAGGTVKNSVKIASSTNGGPALADQDFFGTSLASVGDLDGDGVTDLAVGALGDDTGGNYRGAVHVLFLNATGTVKSSLKIANATHGGPTLGNRDRFGVAVTALGDLDGDGVSDLAVGAYGDHAAATNGGAVYVLFLNAAGNVKNAVKIASGMNGGPPLASNDFFGIGVAAVGDLNGDGITELAVGAYGDDTGGTYRGAVHVLFLKSPSSSPTNGDYNTNNAVDAADYVLWRHTLGSTTNLQANGDNTGPSAGVIDQADYNVWRNNFGNVAPAAGVGAGSAPVAGGAANLIAAEPSNAPLLTNNAQALTLSAIDAAVTQLRAHDFHGVLHRFTASTPQRSHWSARESSRSTSRSAANADALLLALGRQAAARSSTTATIAGTGRTGPDDLEAALRVDSVFADTDFGLGRLRPALRLRPQPLATPLS